MLTATRIGKTPLIRPHMDGRMGDNICGPSLIRMPEWAPGLGRYHLYFADHKGKYLRLAYAERLEGPWTMHAPGAMELEESLFPSGDLPEPPPEERPPWAAKMQGGYLYTHIASPDVHVDHEARLFRMYYHGLLPNGDQATRYAISTDGIIFAPFEPLLGPPYFRAFQHDGWIYAIAWGGVLLRARDWEGPFEQGPRLVDVEMLEGIGRGFRHGEVHLAGDVMHLFYTRMGDRPERILHATMALTGDWMDWRPTEPVTVLEPELDWEGADLPLATSVMGGLAERRRELRDPCLFVDTDGSTWMLYVGGGESGIGLARLEGFDRA